MKEKKIDLNLFAIILSAAGAALSALLTIEYFGGASGVVHALCGAENSCHTVSQSDFSAIRNFPVLGDIPIAVFGFTFYGFLAYIFYLARSTESQQAKGIYRDISFYLISLGLVVDIGLLGISVFVIGAVCNLCASTYAVTLFLFLISLYLKRYITEEDVEQEIENVSLNRWNYTLVILFLFTIGMTLGRLSAGGSNTASVFDEFDKSPKLGIETAGAPVLGDPNAPVTIVKFADFNCGHCMKASKVLRVLLSSYKGIVRVVYKNFPLDGSCNQYVERKQPGASSCVAALGAICADRQGKFKNVYAALYDNNEKGIMHSTASVIEVAANAGVNMDKFRKCMSSPDASKQLDFEIEQAMKLKINSTPSMFVNDKALPPGAHDYEFMQSVVNHIMK